MKRILTVTVAVILLLTMVLSLTSCSSFGSIKSNFVKAGYELDAAAEMTMEIATETGKLTVTVHTFKKASNGGLLDNIVSGLSTAIVYEFGSDADLRKALSENAEISAFIGEAQQTDYVNGNCLLMTVNPDAVKIFKGEFEAK